MNVRPSMLPLITVCAVLTCSGQDSSTQRGVNPTRLSPNPTTTGRFYALIIGINRYRQLQALDTAVNDAQAVGVLLHDQYGFEIRSLLDADATRVNILDAVNWYRRNLRADDNLLVYYAGHGNFDTDAGRAYWLPVDASPDSSSNWISADDLTTGAKTLPARHVLFVADSCYSGGLTRGANVQVKPADRDIYLRKMISARSRNLMASGGNEPVSDAGQSGHSVFANAFLNGLHNMSGSFAAMELFEQYVRVPVAGGSAQVPQYNFLRDSGHEDGDFVFFARSLAMKAEDSAAARELPAGSSRALQPPQPASPSPAPPNGPGTVRPSTRSTDDDGVARAREELRSQGIGLDIASAKNALLLTDIPTLRLLTAAASRPALFEEALRQRAGDGDASVARRFFEASRNAPDAIAWLDEALAKGLNPNLTLAGSYYPKQGLLLEAMRASNAAAMKTLLKRGASPHAYEDLFLTPYADARFLFPLRFIADDDHLTLAEKQDLTKAFLEAGAVVPKPIAPKGGMGWPSVMYEAKNLQDEAAPKLGMKLAPTPTLCEQPATAICRRASERTKEDWCSLVAAAPRKLNFVYGKSSPLYDVTLPYLLGIDDNRMYFLGLQVNSVDTDYFLAEVSKDGSSWTVLRFMSPESGMGLCRKDPDGFQQKDCWRRVALHRAPGTDEMRFDDWGLSWKISADACAPAR